MTNLFSSGPRLFEPSGDPKRQAVDSLRGYAYQLYVSALAWLRLQEDERLYLEVAEDYAIAGIGALQGVQVKDTSGSGRVTINSEGVRQALVSFVDLVERNPRVRVSLRFLSTAEIGQERAIEDRVASQGVLEYWRRAAAGAEIGPLRTAILRADIGQQVRAFIEARDDDALRRDLLQRVFWDCGASGLEEIQQVLADAVVAFGSERLRLSPRDVEGLPAVVLGQVLDTATKNDASARWLNAAALLRLCEEQATTSLPNSSLEGLLRQLLPAGGNLLSRVEVRAALEPVSAIPMPSDVLPRQSVVNDVLRALSQSTLVFLVAGTGMGKSVVARLVASAWPGVWQVLDVRDLANEECEERLRLALGQSSAMTLAGVIVEDVNQLENRRVAAAFARLVESLRKRDVVCLATSYRPVASGVLDSIGRADAPNYLVPPLNEDEVARLVQDYGGDPKAWTRLVFFSGGRGHPQLVRAALAGLRRRGWHAAELAEFSGGEHIVEDIEVERDSVRRQLFQALDKGPRTLLYRTSLLLGRFQRSLGIRLGAISPEVRSAGESLDILVGPWIDAVGTTYLRVSPLVAGAGGSVLSPDEQLAVHRAAAETMFVGNSLDVGVANELFFHALRGAMNGVLLRLAFAVITEPDERHVRLAPWLPSLRLAATNAPIFPGEALLSRSLRLAQFLLSASLKEGRARVVWESLQSEIAAAENADEARSFELLALGKSLFASNLPAVVPDWLSLLRRMRTLVAENAEFGELMASADANVPLFEGARGSSLGVVFIFNAAHVESVRMQLELFRQLDALSAQERADFLEFATSTRGGVTTMVNGPWLAEVRRGGLSADESAAAYREMSALARRWGYRSLAIALIVANSIMLDQYANNAEDALETLRAAEEAFGPSFDLARARAKVHFRRGQHRNMLAVVHELGSDFGSLDASERVVLFREAAISSAEAGDWPTAANWFLRAQTEALTLTHEREFQLSLGLQADRALALYRGGQKELAIQEYAAVIGQLPHSDVQLSLGSAYVSRVVRHGVLWLYQQAIGSDLASAVGEERTMLVPGMCSNPTPSEEIRQKPLVPVEATWYLFSAVESEVMPASQAFSRLQERLHGRHIPALELLALEQCVETSIRALSPEQFAALAGRWLELVGYWTSNRDTMAHFNMERPEFIDVRPATPEELASEAVTEAVQHAVVTFGIAAGTAGQPGLLHDLSVRLSGVPGTEEGRRLLEVMTGIRTVDGATRLPDFAATQVRRVLSGIPLSAEGLFDATLRFVQVGSSFRFKAAVSERVNAWSRQRWGAQIQLPFAFRTPRLTIPSIQRALEVPGLPGVAAALLAAEVSLSVSLARELRAYLQGLVDAATAAAGSPDGI